MVELQKVYDGFCVIDEEYETLVSSEEHAEHQIVNGLDITAYQANVNKAYIGARNAYMQAKASKTSCVSPPVSVSIPAEFPHSSIRSKCFITSSRNFSTRKQCHPRSTSQ